MGMAPKSAEELSPNRGWADIQGKALSPFEKIKIPQSSKLSTTHAEVIIYVHVIVN